MLVIGDVHGKLERYYQIIKKEKQSIQVGDFGFKRCWDWLKIRKISKKHKIIMGNHDYYPYVESHSHSLKHWGYNEKTKIFHIRGASSIDKHLRTEGIDWFADEELLQSQFYEVMSDFEKFKPEIVISHDCPFQIRKLLFGYEDKNITCQGLQGCFEIHQPRLWLFGHHHSSVNVVVENTKFICLDELETYKL